MYKLLIQSLRYTLSRATYLKVLAFMCIVVCSASVSGPRAWGAGTSGSGNILSNFFQSLDQSNTLSGLTQYINTLHSSGSNSGINLSNSAVNSFGSYVGGSGAELPVSVYPSGQSNSPAIIYFPSSDGLGDTNAASELARGAGNPAGGGANARGITVIQMATGGGSMGGSYENALRGVQHVMQNASIYNIDPSKIALMGDSDGGSLAMQVAASGESGAKAAVGWSPQTNMFTSAFKSMSMMQFDLSKMSCVMDGSGGSSSALSGLGQVLTQFSSTVDPTNTISKSIIAQSGLSQPSSPFNLTAQIFQNCLRDFEAGSPALETSSNTPPTYLAGFDNDPYVSPQQIYDMRDKLQSMGVGSGALISPGAIPASASVGYSLTEPLGIALDGDRSSVSLSSARIAITTTGVAKAFFPDYKGPIGVPVQVRLTDVGNGNTPCSAFPPNVVNDVIKFGSIFLPGAGRLLPKGLKAVGSLANKGKKLSDVGSSGSPDTDIYCYSTEYLCNGANFTDGTPKRSAEFCGNEYHLGYDPDYVCNSLSFVESKLDYGSNSQFDIYQNCTQGQGCPPGYTNDGAIFGPSIDPGAPVMVRCAQIYGSGS